MIHKRDFFMLRLRQNRQVVREGYVPMTIAAISKDLKRGEKQIIRGGRRPRQNATGRSPSIRLIAMRLKTGGLLALAWSGNPRRALENHRRRWTMETPSGNMKTRGFNMEDTHHGSG